MPVKGPLSAPELTLLAQPHVASWGLVAVQNTPIATATVSSVDYTNALINVTGTSAGWLNAVRESVVVVYLGSVVRWVGRMRLQSIAGVLYINEISSGDPGLVNVAALRSAGITAGDSLAVYDRADLNSVIPRIVASSSLVYEDFNQSVSSESFAPGPTINITANGKAGDPVFFVDSGVAYATVVLVATGVNPPTSVSIAAYAWTVPASWGAPVAGAANTATVTYHVPVGGRTNYTYSVILTDDAGTPRSAYRALWVVDRASNPPIAVSEVNIQVDESGAKATVTLIGSDLSLIPATGNQVCLFNTALFGGSAITSAWNSLTGWIVKVTESTLPGQRSATLEIEGPAGILSKLGSYSQYVTAVSGIPSSWQEIKKALANMDWLLRWLATVRAKNLATRFNWTNSSIATTSQDLPVWKIDASGNLFAQMQTIAAVRQCSFGINPDGEVMVRRIPSLIDYALPRSAYTITRCTFTPSMYSKITFNKEVRPRVRRDRIEAFTWNGASALPTPLLADAPGNAPGQGTADERYQSQVVDTQTELNQVGGDHLAMQNNPYADIEIELPGLWGLLVYPAEQVFYGLTVGAAQSPDGIAKSLNIIIKSVAIRSEGSGAYTTVVNAYAETTGVAALSVPVPVQVTTPSAYQQLPPTPAPTDIWGARTRFAPSELFALGNNATAYRIAVSGTTATITDISPDVATRASLGGSGLQAVANPWLYGQALIACAAGIAVLNNFWTAAPTPATPWNVVYTAAAGKTVFSTFSGSINRQNFFAWLERDGSAVNYFCYTTDDFATTHSISVGFCSAANMSIAISCFNSLSTGLIFMFGPTLFSPSDPHISYVDASDDWGLTWSRLTSIPQYTGGGFGPVTVSYNKPGGGEDSTMLYNRWINDGTQVVYDTNGVISSTTAVGGSPQTNQTFNSFTLDSRRLYFTSGQHVFRSNDGLTFIDLGAVLPGIGVCLNGWPTNPDWLVCSCSDGSIAVSFDGGYNWTTIATLPNYAVTVWANLEEVYASTVHP